MELSHERLLPRQGVGATRLHYIEILIFLLTSEGKGSYFNLHPSLASGVGEIRPYILFGHRA